MQFRFKTMRKTRQSYNAQQIYWEIVKLKKYFKLNTLFGEPKTPPILFHRVQLPYRFKTIDMEQLVEDQQKPSRGFYWLSIGTFSFVVGYYLAQLLHDDQFRYFAFVRYPEYMRQFEFLHGYLNRKQLEMIERLHLQGKELKGRVGYHNIKSGIMSLFEREKQELDLVKADNSLTNLEEFLQEQDEKIIGHCKLNREKSYQLLFVILSYIIRDQHFKLFHAQPNDALNLIMLLKQHIQNDPCLRMRLLEQSVNLRVDDIDLHFQCKKQIADLQDKLKFREQKLAETTCSYLKDLSNVREQLYRQANAGQEYYEVQYFDSFEIGDQKYLNLLNAKLGQVKAQFDQKTKYLFQVIEAQKKEVNTLNRELQDFQVKQGYFANPEYLLRKLLYLEKDPYKIWKLIQENAGNPHFFQVFQLQKKGYGIDYNKLLLSSQAQDRDFQFYKESLNTQIVQFMERVLNEAQMLRDQIEEKQSEIDGYKRHQKKYRMVIQHQVDKVIGYVFRQYNSLLLKLALKKWQLKDKLSDFLLQISEFKLTIQQQQVTDYLIFDISQLQDKVSILQNQLVNQKFINKQLELRKDLLENCVNSVQKVLNIKVGTIEFETKLLKLDNFQIRHSTELVEKLEQIGQTYDRYVAQFKKESKYVQTDYCNPQLLDKELISLISIETDKQLQPVCQNCIKQSQTNNSPQKQLKNSEKKETIFSRARTPISKHQTEIIPQPHHQNSIYIEREYLQQAMLSPKSNLINFGNTGNELPKLRRQSQVRKELKKQLLGIQNLSLKGGSDSEVDRSRNNTYRKGLRKRPQVIIQYQQYPEEEILKNIS